MEFCSKMTDSTDIKIKEDKVRYKLLFLGLPRFATLTENNVIFLYDLFFENKVPDIKNINELNGFELFWVGKYYQETIVSSLGKQFNWCHFGTEFIDSPKNKKKSIIETTKQEYKIMVEYFKKSVEKGYTEALFQLGLYYSYIENYQKMRKYFLLSIENGHIKGISVISHYCEKFNNFKMLFEACAKSKNKEQLDEVVKYGRYFVNDQCTDPNFADIIRFFKKDHDKLIKQVIEQKQLITQLKNESKKEFDSQQSKIITKNNNQ